MNVSADIWTKPSKDDGPMFGVKERLAKICVAISGFGIVEATSGVGAIGGLGGVSSPSPKS